MRTITKVYLPERGKRQDSDDERLVYAEEFSMCPHCGTVVGFFYWDEAQEWDWQIGRYVVCPACKYEIEVTRFNENRLP